MSEVNKEKSNSMGTIIAIITGIIFFTFLVFVGCVDQDMTSYATWGFGILLGVELFTSLIVALVIGLRISKN